MAAINRIKNELEDWLPPKSFRLLLKAISYLKFAGFKDKKILSSNLELKGRGKGKRAFLLATGPSIKTENLKLLAGEDCFTVSNFFLHKDINAIKPVAHFFAPFHEPLILENYIEWLRLSDQKLSADTEIFLGHTGKEIVEKYNLFPGRKVRYLYLTFHPGRDCTDLLKPVLAPQTGPLMILPVLFYMGYEVIHLLGCDHTVLRNYGNRMDHFYDPDMDKRKNASDTGAWADIVTELNCTLNVFKQYSYYKTLMKKRNIQIINLSRDSWLDIFPFDTFERVLK